MDVFLKCLARLSAIADFPVPQIPLMKISLFPFSIASRISLTTSAWVFPLENFRGSSFSPSVSKGLTVFGFSFLLYNDHILLPRVRGRGLGF